MSLLPYTGIAEGKRTDGDLARISHHHPSLHGQIACERPPRYNGPSICVFRPGHSVCCREMAGILAWFWNERFWLPHNVTWADLKNTDEATFPQAEDLYLACPLAFCIFMIRLVFERWVCSEHMRSFLVVACDTVCNVDEMFR